MVRVFVDSKQVALGTIIRADGWIITKSSLLSADVECELYDGRKLRADLKHISRAHDLAFLKVDAEDLPVTSFPATRKIQSGSNVAAVQPGQFPQCGVVSVEARAVPREKTWSGDGLSDTPRGVEVVSVSAFTREEVALRPGDTIRGINGFPTPDVETLIRLLQQELTETIPGDLVEMKVTRADRDVTLMTPLFPSDDYLQREIDSSYTLRRSGFADVFDTDIPLTQSSCGGPVIDVDGKSVGIVIASRGRNQKLRGPTMVSSSESRKGSYRSRLAMKNEERCLLPFRISA